MNLIPALLAIGLFVNSALYFAFVFVASVVLNRHLAMFTVIAATGVTYFSYYAQIANLVARSSVGYTLAGVLVLMSIVLGALAGLFLVV